MIYEDERLATLRWKERKKRRNSIETGIYVGNRLYQFKEQKLFEGEISVMLPDDFDFMPPERAKYKYPSEFRPQAVVSDATEQVNLTFSRFEEDQVSWESLFDTLTDMQVALKNVHPSILVFHKETVPIQENPVPWMDFKSYGMDGMLYNFSFLWRIRGGMVLGMFNCPYRDMQEWGNVFFKIIETIKE